MSDACVISCVIPIMDASRSRFWLGIISHRDLTITLPEAQMRQMRAENLNAEFARRLHQHSVEEMGYLAEILPTLYRRITLDNVY